MCPMTPEEAFSFAVYNNNFQDPTDLDLHISLDGHLDFTLVKQIKSKEHGANCEASSIDELTPCTLLELRIK